VKRYLVVEESVCPECEGDGVVLDPCWREYLELGDPHRDPDGFAREECGLEEMPPEEIECPTCGGTGVIRREVPLEEALAALEGEVRHG